MDELYQQIINIYKETGSVKKTSRGSLVHIQSKYEEY